MKEGDAYDSFAIAWRYPGLGEVEIIPAIYSRTKVPIPCSDDFDCDDGMWCNGRFISFVVRFLYSFCHVIANLIPYLQLRRSTPTIL